MIRALAALLLIAAIVGATVFFADHPGRVEIAFLDYRVRTSSGFLVGTMAALALLAAVLALLVAAMRRLPRNLRRRREARRRTAADRAVTRGLVALAAGQAAEAAAQARRVTALVGETPVSLLLAAEAAQRQDDTLGARRVYEILLDRPDTEFLGLRGLIGQALRAGDDQLALRLTGRARALRPDARWVIESLLVLQARAGDWEGARETLTAGGKRNALPPEIVAHNRGVVLHQLSRAAERDGDNRRAAALAGKAAPLVADLPGPAHDRARLLLALGRKRAAKKAIERAWRTAPHPDLVRLYLQADAVSGPLARAAALQRLAEQNPDAAESHVAIGEAALAAQLWGEARRHLTIAVAEAPPPGPSRQLCLLMARLEESEDGDKLAARGWLDRAIAAPADPCYACTACGGERLEWEPLCPSCGALDTLRWRRAGGTYRPLRIGAGDDLAPLILPTHNAAGAPNGLAAPPQSANNPP
jgi:HemY protein